MTDLRTYLGRLRALTRSTASRRSYLSPKRDWYLLLGAGVCASVVFVLVGAYVYHRSTVLIQDFAEGGAVAHTRTPERAEITEMVERYREQARRFEELRSSSPTQQPGTTEVSEPGALEELELPAESSTDTVPVEVRLEE